MYPSYDQLFNPQFVNDEYLRQQRMQYDIEQNYEIAKAVKAIHDYCDAARKIDPQYQQLAFNAYIAAVLEELQKG